MRDRLEPHFWLEPLSHFAFWGLPVMTKSCTHSRDDDVFRPEHFRLSYGSPKTYTALPAAIATYSFPSTANAIGAA